MGRGVVTTVPWSRLSREDQQYVRIVSYDFRGPNRLAQRTGRARDGQSSLARAMRGDSGAGSGRRVAELGDDG